MLVCEAAGYDVIFVETVGVGQNEIAVRSMVDFFLLLMITGAGDQLQGIKRGVVEIADALVVNKADGDNKRRAESYRGDLDQALHYLLPATEGWETHAYVCSSLTGKGIDAIWSVIQSFRETTEASGVFKRRRRLQARDWMYAMVSDQLQQEFRNHPGVNEMLPSMEQAVMDGSLPPTSAARFLLEKFRE
jgi:LAO/AO transport system kinase